MGRIVQVNLMLREHKSNESELGRRRQ